MKVHLRKRKQSKKGAISLYLEIYKGTKTTPEGKTKVLRDYEYLNLYLTDKPKTPIERQQNKDILKLAESIKAKREIEIKNGLYGFSDNFKQNVNFTDYFKDLIEKRKKSIRTQKGWNSTLNHFINFAGEEILFKEIDKKFCQSFKNYLTDTVKKSNGLPLSSSSITEYFNKFQTALNQAVRENIISFNPARDVKIKKAESSKREYLTFEELKAIAKTDCRNDVLKRAFLFSCLTGLRWSDVHKLKWSEVSRINGNWRITFNQKKTNGLQYLDISDQAKKYMGVNGKPDDRIFDGLTYSNYMNIKLSRWMMKAGITKHITFHCARHTFAVLQLSFGTEIYTLSKLLGHSEIKTTQIYSDIIDEKKREAANIIPDINI